MNNATRSGTDKKLSQVTGQTTIDDSALLLFTSANTETRSITFGELKAALGVTGTISSVGDPAGTPVLEQILAQSNIRIMENGPGIAFSTSPQNGITGEHNFVQDGTGEPITSGLVNLQPVFKSMVGFDGVKIETDGDAVKVGLSIPPGATKTVIITQESDLPTPIAGQHHLADDTDYLITNDLDTGVDGFLMGNNTVVRAADSSIVTLSYTGTNPMFESISNTNKITMLRIDCPNAAILDLSGATDYVFQFINCSVTSCDSIGTIDDVQAMQINDVSFESITTDGLLFAGANGVCLMGGNLLTPSAGIAIDLGTSTFSGFSLTNNFAALGPGATFLNGAASSANMNAGDVGTVVNNKNISNVGTMLTGITPDDAQWEFSLNEDIADTRPDGLLSVDGPITVTITTINTPVKIGVATDWVIERVSQMTGSDSGTLTYDGSKDVAMPMTGNIAAEPVTGTNLDYTFYWAIDGVIIPNSAAVTTVSSGGPKNTAILWQELIESGQTLELWVENNTNTADLVVNSGILRVN